MATLRRLSHRSVCFAHLRRLTPRRTIHPTTYCTGPSTTGPTGSALNVCRFPFNQKGPTAVHRKILLYNGLFRIRDRCSCSRPACGRSARAAAARISCRCASTRQRLTIIASLPRDFLGRNSIAPSLIPMAPMSVASASFAPAPRRSCCSKISDDAPTLSRRGVLVAALLESGADLIGSHELHVNEIWRKVMAIRYPLDASAALAAADGHTLLLPTSAGRRDAIRAAGGFSTIRTFNSDLEFVFRAFFSLKLRNVDEFLYIRRSRAGSLTQAPETGILSPAREAHSAALRKDFERIKRRELSLEGSVLKTQHRSDFEQIRIDRLR